MNTDLLKKHSLFSLVLALTLFLVTAPLLTGSWPSGHDGSNYLYRTVEFHSLQKGGEIYPRWCPDFYMGYGYPFYVFYSPGTFFLASALMFAGFSVVVSLHLVSAIGVVILFAGTYRFCRLWSERREPAIVGAALASLANYRFVQLYVRGDLAEVLATCFAPWVLCEAVTLCRKPSIRSVSRLAIFLSFAFLTHLLTGIALLLAVACIAAWMLVLRRKFNAVGALLAGSLLGLSISVIYLLPAFLERKFVETDK